MNKHYKWFTPSYCAGNLYIGMKSSFVGENKKEDVWHYLLDIRGSMVPVWIHENRIWLWYRREDIFLCVCSTSIKSLLLKKRERLSNVEQFHWAPRPVTSEVTSKRCWISSWPAGNSNHQYGSLSSSPGAAPGEELATSVFSPCPGQWQWKMFQMTNHIMNTNGHFPSGILQALYPCPLWQSP